MPAAAGRIGAGVFVTGTDTSVGKSILAGALIASLRARDISVGALKPVITGLDQPPDPDWPPDHVLLARAAGCSPEDVVVEGYGAAVSPHLAAALEGRPVVPTELVEAARRRADECEILVVEGVGGLLVPIGPGFDVRQLALGLGFPLLVAARPGLGTINHTLLTLEAARAVGLEILSVVLTPWPSQPSAIERSNRETIEQLGRVPVSGLAHIAGADRDGLAAAGRQLPLDAWLASLTSRSCSGAVA